MKTSLVVLTVIALIGCDRAELAARSATQAVKSVPALVSLNAEDQVELCSLRLKEQDERQPLKNFEEAKLEMLQCMWRSGWKENWQTVNGQRKLGWTRRHVDPNADKQAELCSSQVAPNGRPRLATQADREYNDAVSKCMDIAGFVASDDGWQKRF